MGKYRTLFGISLIAVVMAVVAACYLGAVSIGRINEIKTDSDAIDERNLQFTPKFRAQVYRLQATALRFRVTGDERYITKFEAFSQELAVFLSEREEIFTTEAEMELLAKLRARKSEFELSLAPIMKEQGGEDGGEAISLVQERQAGMVDLLQGMGDEVLSLELRWRLQKCHSAFLTGYLKSEEQVMVVFEEAVDDLKAALEKGSSDTLKEEVLAALGVKLERYAEEARTVLLSQVEKGSARKRFEDLEHLQQSRDQLIEVVQSLGESRRAAFRDSLSKYRNRVNSLRYSVFLMLAALCAALCALCWLAYRAFLKPVEDSLIEAEDTAEEKTDLAMIGTLAAGVAHEIRNPLATIKARLFALNELVTDNESATNQMVVLRDETDRLENIVRDFLDFARPAEPNRKRTNLADFLDDAHALMLPAMEERGIRFELDHTAESICRVDAEQLKQVFYNLVRNAADACPQRDGEIRVSSELCGEQLEIRIRDNGEGIPEEIREQIYEPFFTEKKAGTGLGLAICKNIIKGHEGELTFESDGVTGTTFIIRLNQTKK